MHYEKLSFHRKEPPKTHQLGLPKYWFEIKVKEGYYLYFFVLDDEKKYGFDNKVLLIEDLEIVCSAISNNQDLIIKEIKKHR